MAEKTRNIEFTAIVCGYKAARAFKLCLHQLARYGFSKDNLIISENSPTYFTSNRALLDQHNISYISNPDMNLVDALNAVLPTVKTKYALILDSDAFCVIDPIKIFEKVKTHNLQLYGEIVNSRGGFNIHKRVNPCYCFVDVEFLKQNDIKFNDPERITATNSIPMVDRVHFMDKKNPKVTYYDAGSTMFEDVQRAGGIVGDIGEFLPYIHIGAVSWQEQLKNPELAAKKDNWIDLLYNKLQFNEKYLQLLGKSNK